MKKTNKPAGSTGDADLVRIVAVLRRQASPGFRRVRVALLDDAIVLRGEVHSFYAKQILQHSVRLAAGDRRVIDEVSVLPPADFRDPIRLRRAAATGALLFVALLFAGCSRQEPGQVAVYPVRGTVTVGGQPAAGAQIVFHSKDGGHEFPSPRAQTDKSGAYTLSTYSTGDGAPLGDYVVTVEWSSLIAKENEFLPGPSLVPPKYTNQRTSTLVARVADGENETPISIVR